MENEILNNLSPNAKEKLETYAKKYKQSVDKAILGILETYFMDREEIIRESEFYATGSDLQTELFKITKHDQDTIYYAAHALDLDSDQTLRYILQHYSFLWPFEKMPFEY